MIKADALKNLGKYYINGEPTVYTYTDRTKQEYIFLTPAGETKVFKAKDITKIEEVSDPTSGIKFDGVGKLRWDLVPTVFKEVVKVLTLGAKKYADNNWQYVEPGYNRYYAAAKRHMEDFREAIETGQPRLDKEMKTHLLANAICDLIFLMWNDMNGWPYQKKKPTETKWDGGDK